MAKTLTKSKTLTKKPVFRFRWWMGLALVALVAVVGIVIVFTSRASISSPYIIGDVIGVNGSTVRVRVTNTDIPGLYNGTPIDFVNFNNTLTGNTYGVEKAWQSDYYGYCAVMKSSYSYKGANDVFRVGDKASIQVIQDKNSSNCYGHTNYR